MSNTTVKPPACKPAPCRSQLGAVGGLLDRQAQLPARASSSRAEPTTAMQGAPTSSTALRDGTDLRLAPRRSASSSAPSPVTTKSAAAASASKPMASKTNSAPGTSPACCSTPRGPPASPLGRCRCGGTPRGSRGASAARPAMRRSSLVTVAGSAPSAGPKTDGARSPRGGPRRRSTISSGQPGERSHACPHRHSMIGAGPPNASASAASAPAPPSVVAEPPTATITRRATPAQHRLRRSALPVPARARPRQYAALRSSATEA